MGCAPKESSGAKTEDLIAWISKFKTKRMQIRQKRYRDLLVETVLSNALCVVQKELDSKQKLRRMKWLERKKLLQLQPAKLEEERDGCEDLASLDRFLTNLNQIKVPVR